MQTTEPVSARSHRLAPRLPIHHPVRSFRLDPTVPDSTALLVRSPSDAPVSPTWFVRPHGCLFSYLQPFEHAPAALIAPRAAPAHTPQRERIVKLLHRETTCLHAVVSRVTTDYQARETEIVV